MVIVTHIGQKLNSVKHKKTLLVTHYGQLFSQIMGGTLLLVTNYGRKPTLDQFFKNDRKDEESRYAKCMFEEAPEIRVHFLEVFLVQTPQLL